jgi:hypothetical protein
LNTSNNTGEKINRYHPNVENVEKFNNSSSNDNKEAFIDNHSYQPQKLILSGATNSVKEKLDNQKYIRPFTNPKINSDINKNIDRIHQLLPGSVNASAVQQLSANPASPLSSIHRSLETLLDRESHQNVIRNIFTDTNLTSHPKTQGHTDKVLVDSSCEGVKMVFKTQVRQSLLEFMVLFHVE